MALELNKHAPLPLRFADLKLDIAPKDEDSKRHFTEAWNDLLVQLRSAVDKIKAEGSDMIPQVEFADLQNLKPEEIENIKRRGTVLVRNVVDNAQAAAWKFELENFVKVNPVEGVPEDDKQFFQHYWTRPQVQARAHPNVLNLITWLNNLYHVKVPTVDRQFAVNEVQKGVELATPLTYADRFRIRHPGVQWNTHPPHIDGGGIERWEEPTFRSCYKDILNGNWKNHDSYNLASVFRTFQGWLALSETAPTQGTLKVFPDVLLSSAYLILRPFFRLKEDRTSDDLLDQANWELDVSTPDFPGIFERDGVFFGPRLTPASHPHLRLEESMTAVPSVKPGDMVFWHCDVVHSVEQEHTGKEDSAVMYIPAVPLTPQNLSYVARQKESFLRGIPPPDFPKGAGEGSFIGVGKETDVIGEIGRKAMGLAF
ncbi:hypothetical protein EW145_g1713 [Phellinidium pouzarii]|uniref:DUF1479 domain protein n=1 Tax=Phellinidium pouzarii TaxID=167371 RepID=A0A4S4LFC3_9AGAM|nr:hypothetical protein EW145_g1713 [Phellinidium pouzarii]